MPTDRIIYESPNGNIYWTYDTESDVFITLNLPNFMYTAPDNVKHDLVEWIRHRVKGTDERMPESVRQYRDDPKTIRIRAKMKRGYVNLEDFA